MLESLFATLTAKLALGGVAVAMAATGGLAATGNLPDKAQTAVAQAMDNVGIELPLGETAQQAAEAVERAGQAAAEALERAKAPGNTPPDGLPEVTPGAPDANADLGQGVATDARDQGAGSVADLARQQAEERREAGQANRPGEFEPPAPGQFPPAGAVPAPGAVPEGEPGPGVAGETPGGGQIPSSLPGGKPAGAGGARP